MRAWDVLILSRPLSSSPPQILGPAPRSPFRHHAPPRSPDYRDESLQGEMLERTVARLEEGAEDCGGERKEKGQYARCCELEAMDGYL